MAEWCNDLPFILSLLAIVLRICSVLYVCMRVEILDSIQNRFILPAVQTISQADKTSSRTATTATTATALSHRFGINDQDKKERMTVDNV